MSIRVKPQNVKTLKEALEKAEAGQYAIGSFAPRYLKMIAPILRAGEKAKSPVIVQISQKEMERYGITPKQFADAFYLAVDDEHITIPAVLHLDHTKHLDMLKEAVLAGFTSVMIDASEHELEMNIAISREAAEFAHAYGVSVEAELGRIGTTDFVETDSDEELYTDPEEAELFVKETKADALAVSVGTAHGVYLVRQPKIDFARLQAIRSRTPVHLVLHGGSGVPAAMMKGAIMLPNGGVSKVNIATDLELAFLQAIGREERMTDAECSLLPAEQLRIGQEAVERTVAEKITHYLGSSNQAWGSGE
jgi:ketose-bisphosphate aldolase